MKRSNKQTLRVCDVCGGPTDIRLIDKKVIDKNSILNCLNGGFLIVCKFRTRVECDKVKKPLCGYCKRATIDDIRQWRAELPHPQDVGANDDACLLAPS